MQLFKEVLTKYKLIDYCEISDHNKLYKLPNGSEILFLGLDDETKLLSIQDISDIWVEETFEVEKDILAYEEMELTNKAEQVMYDAVKKVFEVVE